MSRLIKAAFCFLLFFPGLPLAAQVEEVTLRIEVNDKHLEPRQRFLTGTLLEPRMDCINLLAEGTGERCVPIDSVRKVSVVVGQTRNVGRAMRWGGVAGAFLGALIGAVIHKECGFNAQLGCGGGSSALGGMFLGSTLGSGIGLIYAAMSSPSPVWRDAEPGTFTRHDYRIPPVGVGLRVMF